MPRPSQDRVRSAERHVADRIAHERARLDISIESLAKLVTDAGCPMNGSAVYRIEKGDPPRRINVDELIAFAKVFGIRDPLNMTLPLATALTEEAAEAWIEFSEKSQEADAAWFRLVACLDEPMVAKLLMETPDASPQLRKQAFLNYYGESLRGRLDINFAWATNADIDSLVEMARAEGLVPEEG